MLVENEPKAAKEAAGEGKSKTSVGETEEPQRKKFTRETDINPFGPMRYDGIGSNSPEVVLLDSVCRQDGFT
jgi:hypothetical protein